MSRTNNEFVNGYLVALAFTEFHADNPELEHATIDDIADTALATIVFDCCRWQRRNEGLLNEAYQRGYRKDQAGHDYWLTRNGHGSGFWSRPKLESDGLGDKLTAACEYTEQYVYLGDDKKVYIG